MNISIKLLIAHKQTNKQTNDEPRKKYRMPKTETRLRHESVLGKLFMRYTETARLHAHSDAIVYLPKNKSKDFIRDILTYFGE